MRADNAELGGFYDSRQGQVARRLIALQLRQLWPDLSGRTVVGLGYAMPYLDVFLDEAAAVVALQASTHGCTGDWPGNGRPSRLAVVVEDELPLADRSVDRLLLVHGLETARNIDRLMREIWRVLADDGRIVVVVPNRRGLWTLSETTPFGQGRPFSSGQIERLLRRHLLGPTGTGQAVFVPPWPAGLLLRMAVPMERLGLRLLPQFAGILLVEAEKQIYIGAPALEQAAPARRRYAALPEAVAVHRDGEVEDSLRR